MTEVQVGSTFRPIRLIPKVGGVPVTQTDIKNNYSNLYVDDPSTPLTWVLEWKRRGDTNATTINFNSGLSTDSEIYFDIPDSFYAAIQKYTVLFAWVVTGASDTEKIYCEEAIQIDVRDLHKGR